MIGIPLAALMSGVILQICLGRVLTPAGKGWLAFLAGLAALLATLSLIGPVAQGIPLDASLLPWDGQIALQVHVDGLSLVFALMATGIGSAILLYCIGYMAHEKKGATRFYILMLTFIGGLVSLVFSANLLLAYLSWELIGLCSYFLVGFWYQNPSAVNGARKVLLMTHIPGYALLLGILLLYSQSGTFLWTDPALAAGFNTGIFLLLLAAAMAKSVMVPLHTWIPEAMNAPTPVSALLHSACYVKAGIYLVARFYSLLPAPWPVAWQTIVLVIGCATMLVGALFALAQTDLKRLLAYSTISQLGYLITGLGLGTPAAISAALFYTFSHGLFKGTLFLCAGSVQHSTGTRDMREIGGLAARMPRTTLAWMIAAAAIVGVPLTNGFVSKWLLFDAALGSSQWIVVSIAWLVSVVTAFYILKATANIFFGPLPQALLQRGAGEAPASMQAGMGLLAALCLLSGIAPQALYNRLVVPAAQALGFSETPVLTWFGVHSANGGSTALSGLATALGGAFLVLLALLAGLGILLAARARQAPAADVFSGGEALPVDNTVGVEDFAAVAELALQPVYRLTDPDPFYRRLWNGVLALSDRAAHLGATLERRPLLAVLLIGLAIAAAAWL